SQRGSGRSLPQTTQKRPGRPSTLFLVSTRQDGMGGSLRGAVSDHHPKGQRCMLRQGTLLTLALIAATGAAARTQDNDRTKGEPERLFSGPQVGEKLPPFRVRGVFDADAGKDLDFVTQAAGKPVVLVFVHDVNRQSVGMTRALTGYTVGRAK